MSCEDARAAIPTYLDEELDAATALGIEAHLRGCAACGAIAENERVLRRAFKDPAFRFAAPPDLESRVHGALAAQPPATRPPRRPPWEWLGIAAAFVLGAILATLVARAGLNRASDLAIAREVLSSHLRSLQAGHLVDVPSSDQHTVKPWFDGKVDFSPSVPDLSADGFPLAGGRLDVIQGRPIAALVYRRRLHVINVFTWPSAAGREAGNWTLNGYHVFRWDAGGNAYWAASDVDPNDLATFVKLYRERGR